MPKDQQKHHVSRQRPVSCRFCRSRKLRCSRETPCSNCISRGIRCELEIPADNSSITPNASEPELLERIRKLEELVEIQESQQKANAKEHPQSSDTRTLHTCKSTPSPQTERLDEDVAWLESIYSSPDLLDKIPSSRVVFRTCPIQLIKQAQQYISQNSFFSSTSLEPSRCVWLPQYPEAKLLLEKFIHDIDHIHHVVHCPSLPTILDEVYACLNQQGQVKPGTMILLLAIIASCTHSWVQKDCERGLFSTSAEANSQSPLWIKAIEDVLDIAHRTACVSIEGIQGIIITSFVLGNLEGISRRCRSMYNVALLLARELGLHCLDHPSNAHLANLAQAEMGRRVWWYIVASDWSIAARLGGGTQGVYQCHLRHMMVKKPLNINDEEVINSMSRNEQPLSKPTAMSYSLQRIRLSEISRCIVDRNPLMILHAGGPSLDVVMDVDTELQLFINDIPPFFSMSVADLTENYQLKSIQAAKIAHQGYMIHSLVYAQRCKLHFPYFNRGFVDSVCASSRDICLQSARLLIQTESRLEISGLCTSIRFKFFGLLCGVFMASIVVLMDLCHNKSSPQQEEQRGEIVDAFRILKEARHESEMAGKFLESMMHVLSKHKVSPPKNTEEQPLKPEICFEQLPTVAGRAVVSNGSFTQKYSESAMMSTPIASSVLGSNETNSIKMAGDSFANGEDFSSYFNEFAESFGQGIDVGNIDWNDIFSGLDNSLM